MSKRVTPPSGHSLHANPFAWLAALLIDRILKFAFVKVKEWIAAAAIKTKLKKENAKDKQNADTYRTTLEDGVSDTAQVDASLGVLNDREPKPKP
jgi:hypothetical protein